MINKVFSRASTYCTPVPNAAQIPLVLDSLFVIYYFVPPYHLPHKDEYDYRTYYDTPFIFVNATKKQQAKYQRFNKTTDYWTIWQCFIGPYLPLEINLYFQPYGLGNQGREYTSVMLLCCMERGECFITSRPAKISQKSGMFLQQEILSLQDRWCSLYSSLENMTT